MPAIITDQIRVLNAENFVNGISTTTNSYYVFIGLPNATEINSDWNTNTPAPIDNFDDHDNIYDTLISAKKVNSSDVLQVIRKISWTTGTIYECIDMIMILITQHHKLIQQVYTILISMR